LEGDAGMKEYVLRTSKKSASSPSAVTQGLETLRTHIRVYFPSQQTVDRSLGGRNVSLRLFCRMLSVMMTDKVIPI
jgi:hypothetical protein